MEQFTHPPQGYTCHRRLHFSAGHRVLGHAGPCARLHGHNYVVWISAVAEKLDEMGMVVDFSVLRDVVGQWIDDNWDHRFLINRDDSVTLAVLNSWRVQTGIDDTLYVCDFNPTAEEMAGFLLRKSEDLLKSYGVKVVSVKIYETENCLAASGAELHQ